MKIKKEHYKVLENSINAAIRLNPGLLAAGIYNNLSAKRIRWDLFYIANGADNGLVLDMYQYLNDENIDTALRAITRGKI